MQASSRVLASWYPRLATALEAGLGLERCLGSLPGPAEAARTALAARLRAGDAIDEALERAGGWLPAVDRQLIAAGARAGRLPDAARRLGGRHEASVRAQIGVALATAYPLGVVHLGALAFPVQRLVDGSGVGAYIAAVAGVLVPLWVVLGGFLLAVRARWRVALAVLDLLPLVAGYRRARALADLAFVLEALIVAGVRIDIAWLQAGIATGDRRLEPLAIVAAEAVQRGEPVGPVLALRREAPSLFSEYYRNGEHTGRLDEALQAVQRHFADVAGTRLKLAGMLYPAVLFLAVAAWVAVRIVLFYTDTWRQIDAITS